VRIGVSLRTAFLVDDVRVGARWIVERAAAARDAGLDCLLVGDHHATPVPYYQNTPLLGRLLAEWGDGPFGALFLLPLWNPVLVAEHVGTLASLGRGRFILPLAVGGRDQFGAMGIHVEHRGKHFEAGFDIVRRLLAGETVNAGDPYNVQEARVSPTPPEPVEVWIAGTAERAVDRAARLGDGFLANADLTPEQARAVIELYRERCEAYGRTRRRSASAETSTWAPTPPTPIAWPAVSSPPATGASTRRRARTATPRRSPSSWARTRRWDTRTSSSAISPRTRARCSSRSPGWAEYARHS
jgi:alkanesulfonate monooxygenase SsuD/methylene tetrahydromethanopterin reductase-like flavin-dependent oxidoreductase (luciferase family)